MNNPPVPAAHYSVPSGYPAPNAMPPNPPPMMPPVAPQFLPPHSFAPAPAPASQFPIPPQHHRPPQQSYPTQPQPQLQPQQHPQPQPQHPQHQPPSLQRPPGLDIVQHFSPFNTQDTPKPQTPPPRGREKPVTPPPWTPLNRTMAQATPVQQAQAKATPQAASTLSPQSLQRERARVTVLLDINSALLKEVVSLQSQGKAGSTAGGQQSPTSPTSATNPAALSNSPVDASRQQHSTGKPPSQEYADCMRRLQANLSYLAAIADAKKKVNGTLPVGPAIMIPPPHLKEVHPLYLKLNELFPEAGQSKINQAVAFASQQGKQSASIPAHG